MSRKRKDASIRAVAGPEEPLWVRYAPRTAKELKVYGPTVAKVRDWLRKATSRARLEPGEPAKRLLVLSGPPGVGKLGASESNLGDVPVNFAIDNPEPTSGRGRQSKNEETAGGAQAVRDGKPLVITEFGMDSYDNRVDQPFERVQAEYTAAQWTSLFSPRGSGGLTVGGVVFEWMDEPWKAAAFEDRPADTQCVPRRGGVHAGWAPLSRPSGYAADAFPDRCGNGAF